MILLEGKLREEHFINYKITRYLDIYIISYLQAIEKYAIHKNVKQILKYSLLKQVIMNKNFCVKIVTH